jgi:hypothetical protein
VAEYQIRYRVSVRIHGWGGYKGEGDGLERAEDSATCSYSPQLGAGAHCKRFG